MRVRIVLQEAARGWIIGKMADRVALHLERLGDSVEIANQPSADADVNHWMSAGEAWEVCDTQPRTRSRNTILVTHADDFLSIQTVRECLASFVDVAVCVSRARVDQLVRHGLAPRQLCAIVPAHDGMVRPRRTVVGVTGALHPDPATAEPLLARLSREVDLSPFTLRIFGDGWQSVIPSLEQAGAVVEYAREADPARLLEAVPRFDYHLRVDAGGEDAGHLNALAAGVETIADPGDLPLYIPGGVTHPFRNFNDLRNIFAVIGRTRIQRASLVQDLTWEAYARHHRELWSDLVSGRDDYVRARWYPPPEPVAPPSPMRQLHSGVSYYLNGLVRELAITYPRRMLRRLMRRMRG